MVLVFLEICHSVFHVIEVVFEFAQKLVHDLFLLLYQGLFHILIAFLFEYDCIL